MTHHPASVRTAIRRKNESLGGTIILIHGLWMHAIVWQVQEVRLQRAGYTVRSISFPSWKGTLSANVERLAKVIAGLPATSIHLVGHSLGGLLALALLSRQPDSRIRRVVLLGSPCLDCHAARQLLSWPLVSLLVGRCLEDWLAAPAPNFPADVEVGIIAGTRRFGLGCVIPGLPTPNDGVVALAETLLPAARDVIALPVSHSGMRRFFPALLAACLGGCSNLGYYLQAAGGHLHVAMASRPLAQVLGDPQTPPGLRNKLQLAAAARDFASRELALPDNGSYRHYADIGRPYAVWNVFAAPEFSTRLEDWCLLLVGCVNYRGFYELDAATRFAKERQAAGLETYIAPIPAYSTLGYFDDPLLNTFMRFGEDEIVRILFHELAHQRVFIPGDSIFNESFANVVENEGMRRWLEHRGRPAAYERFLRQGNEKLRFRRLVADYRARLAEIYASAMTPTEKRQAKATTLEQLRRAHAGAAKQPDAYAGFFAGTLNNATLGSVNLYDGLAPVFEKLLMSANHDLARFFDEVGMLARMKPEQRQAALERVVASPAPCPTP